MRRSSPSQWRISRAHSSPSLNRRRLAERREVSLLRRTGVLIRAQDLYQNTDSQKWSPSRRSTLVWRQPFFRSGDNQAHRRQARNPFHAQTRQLVDITEIGLNVLSRQCLERRIPSIQQLDKQVKAWMTEGENNPPVVNWQFTTDDARIKLTRLYPS